MGGAKLHTETTGFATLNDNGNSSFGHEISTLNVVKHFTKAAVIMRYASRRWRDTYHAFM